MKKLLITLLMCISLTSFATTAPKQKLGKIYNATITRIVDGDTVAIEAKWLPDPLKKEISIRVYGVDTPEKGFRAKCPIEDKKGHDASDFTTSLVNNSTSHKVVLMDWDKYGGRILGDVVLDGKSLRAELITHGYAREYYGEAKTSWCN